MDDRTLIEGTLAGRTRDFEALVERYQKMLYGFAHRQLQDTAAADDVVQATFIQAYRHLARFRGDASFKTWLHQIALNECRARLRRRRAEVPLEEAMATAHAEESDARGWSATLERSIARLPPRQRSVLSLRIFGDLPFRDIARVCGITENAAKVNYHHAIARLRQWLGGGRE